MTIKYCDDTVNEIISGDACAPTCTPTPSVDGCSPYVCSHGNSACGCHVTGAGKPLPFYARVEGCQESHTTVLSQQLYTTSISTGRSFNMPACESSIAILLPGVISLLVGSYMWNPTYGYLKIISFDAVNNTAVVTNECQVDNASPGAEIPSCTLFNIVDPPFEIETECGDGSFITADFIVPALSGSVTLDVSSIVGLAINNKVQVGTGVYTLTSIVTSNSIVIKNDTGYGAAPGTVEQAYDVNGRCITPVTPYAADVCNNPSETSGSIVVCNNSGIVSTLDASVLGQVPVCIDPATNTFEAQNTYIEIPECTFLNACVNLLAGVHTYTIDVDDTSLFEVGYTVNIAYPGVQYLEWIVDEITSGTLMIIRNRYSNTFDFLVPDGVEVCRSSCCRQLNYDLSLLEQSINTPCGLDWSSAQYASSGTSFFPVHITMVVSPGGYLLSPILQLEVPNPTCNEMQGLLTVNFILDSTINASLFAWMKLMIEPMVGYSVLPATPSLLVTAVLGEEKFFGAGGAGTMCSAYDAHYSKQHVYTADFSVPPNSTLRVDSAIKVTYIQFVKGSQICCPCSNFTSEGTGVLTSLASNIYAHYTAVAVQAG